MANFTKQAIKASFRKLLSEKPLNKISVRDIVEDCGINRNSFYYHYQDIPTLIEETVTELFDNLIEKYPSITSLEDCFNEAAAYTLKNKIALLHIYNSVSRDIFEKYLLRFCEYAIATYTETVFPDRQMPETDRRIAIRFAECELFGICLEWLNHGLPEEAIGELQRMLRLCHGLTEEIIRRSKENQL